MRTLYIRTGSKCREGPNAINIGITSILKSKKLETGLGANLLLIVGGAFLFTFVDMQQFLCKEKLLKKHYEYL